MSSIETKCVRCEKWYDKQTEVLMRCETVFDVPIDMRVFEDECIKTCPYKGVEIYGACDNLSECGKNS